MKPKLLTCSEFSRTIILAVVNFNCLLLLPTAFVMLSIVVLTSLSNQASAQGVAINTTGNAANAKAGLDVDFINLGLLIPRLTTVQRDAIATPIPESLLIFNTTTKCFEAYNATSSTWVAFGCIGCTVPTAVSASAAPNPICAGATLTLTGSATGATGWSWTGPNGFTSALQNPTITNITTAAAGVYTLAASNNCGSVQASTASVNVSATPTTAAAGSDINPACGVTTATLAGNNPGVGTGTWSVVSGTATITNNTLYNSGVTGLAVPGTATLRWTISNAPCTPSTDDVVITTTSCCGNFTDARDGKTYGAVLIGSACWMSKNLDYSTSGALTLIATGQGAAGTQKYCYGDNAANCTTYGGLYEWAEMMNGSVSCNGTGAPPNDKCATNVQGICPTGWHIPSHYEWTTLEKNVGSNPGAFPYDITTTGWLGTDEGGNLKETGTSHWTTPNTGATNSSNFSALPGGYSWSGSFSNVGINGIWWSATEYVATLAWGRYLDYTMPSVGRYDVNKMNGFSVRCVKD